MEELFGGGSHRPLGGCRRSGTEKVAAEGVGQKRWLQQRSLGRQIREKGGKKGEGKRGGVFFGKQRRRGVFLGVLRERVWVELQ